jgi:hypothetical protein
MANVPRLQCQLWDHENRYMMFVFFNCVSNTETDSTVCEKGLPGIHGRIQDERTLRKMNFVIRFFSTKATMKMKENSVAESIAEELTM